MDNPKTIYSRSEASRLRDQPCPYCGKRGRLSVRPVPSLADDVDPDVSVLWYCLDSICEGHDGFSIESS
ncbi:MULTISPECIES: hypothetical protein [Streptomyces]|uniref:Uncharacterized protein n=2 Tax=Streptomyces TaxID=1883 RepID=A0A2U9P017_STRAS|nr:hypothetical protein [Streptomyces actuosus]AWT42538.1 hypothetical protein DMT42_09570 [Streptomyces actuosus]MBM4819740.1 hypothetical protein [Streptomyces actuosus]